MKAQVRTLACVVLLWGLAVPVEAQDARYDALIAEGGRLFRHGSFAGSLEKFVEANALRSSSTTLRGMALCELRLGKPVPAVLHAKQALADTREPLPADKRALTLEFVANVSSQLGAYTLHLEPADARVLVDGAPGALDPDGSLWLTPGSHTLRVELDGYQPWSQALSAVANTVVELSIHLVKVESPTVAANVVPAAREDQRHAPVNDTRGAPAQEHGSDAGIAPWLVAGVGGAMLIGAGFTWLMANDTYSSLQARCPDAACMGSGVQSDIDSGKTLVTATDILLIGGAVAVATGATWWAIATLNRQEPTAPSASLLCLSAGCSAHVSVRF